MYCRNCHYDLRGQVEPRCSECGFWFDPRDQSTYFSRVPTGLQTVFRTEGVKTFLKLFSIAALYGVLVLLLSPGIFSSRCGPLSGRELSRSLLHSIVQAHLVTSHTNPEDGTLTIDAIRQNLAPSWYSRSIEPTYVWANHWSPRVGDIFMWSVLGIGPVLGIIVLTRRWLRKLAMAIALLCALLAASSFLGSYVIGGYRRTSSYAYVNDYVLVPGIDWRERARAESSWDRIVAFEKNPWPESRRVVAINAETVRAIKEYEFQQRLLEQPLAKRAWDECVAAGDCAKKP